VACSSAFGEDVVGAATATLGGSMVYPPADRPSTKWGRRRGNLSIDPRKSVSCPLGVTGVRADPPVVAPDLPVSISPVGAIRRSRRSVLRKSLELASYLRIEERELEAGRAELAGPSATYAFSTVQTSPKLRRKF